jgi:chromate transporter
MRERSALEVLLTFLKLGVTSFGGPIAHIGYFRDELVVRRRWIDDPTYADLVALCQFLPGPASSQVGFSLGLMRAGYWGGLAAWAGFTLPSAVLMTAFAYGAGALGGAMGQGVIHGLKLVALAVVAQAVWGMARTSCPDRRRAFIACVAALLILLIPSPLMQIGTILMGGLAGFWLCRAPVPASMATLGTAVSRRVAIAALAMFCLLLIALPALARVSHRVALFDAFYRSGALVFGGGHVVLPLLSKAFVTPGWVSEDAFLAGYGAAQAVPGPLFTFAAYLGAVVSAGPHGMVAAALGGAALGGAALGGAALGLIGIFLPGILVLLGALPFWDASRQRAGAQAMMRGINAAVVGLLGAALSDPLWISSVKSVGDFALALVGFVLLTAWRMPPLIVVILGAFAGVLVS